LAEPSRAAAGVRYGHDRGQVAGIFLEPAEQGREAGAAAQRHHPGALLEEAEVVDDLRERPVSARQERAEHGLGELVKGKTDEAESEEAEKRSSVAAGNELQRQRAHELGEGAV